MRILLVDDNPDVIATLKGMLTDNGYSADGFATPVDALNAILRQDYKIAVIDVRLQSSIDDRSGVILAAAIVGLKPKTQIILITGLPIEDTATSALDTLANLTVTLINKGSRDYEVKLLDAVRSAVASIEQPDTRSDTRFTLSLLSNQPVFVRCSGSYLCSTRTRKTFQINAQRLTRRASLARKSSVDERFSWKELGKELGEELFKQLDEIKEEFAEARSRAQQQSDLLTLKIEVGEEFAGVPFEYIWLERLGDFVVLKHPFSRLLNDRTPQRLPISPSLIVEAKELRVLLIGSNTFPTIDGVDQEIDYLEHLFRSNPKTKERLQVLKTPDATLNTVKRYLSQPFDIIHYAGHGVFDQVSPEESSLLFWQEGGSHGEILRLKANELAMILEDAKAARLVYLSCCEGAASGTQQDLLDDDFLGLADAVVRAGVPTILGYRWPVSDKGAITLAKEFYGTLLRKGSPEIALWKARRELAKVDRNNFDYLSPVMIHQE